MDKNYKIMINIFIIYLVTSVYSDVKLQINYLNNNNPQSLQTLDYRTLETMNILTDRPFKVLIHGWTEFGDENYYSLLSFSYFLKGSYNILQVDWSESSTKDYVSASKDAVSIANYLGDIIYRLHTTRNVSLDSFHLIGHSVGAQIAGFTGQYVHGKSGTKVGRITGLDPAAMLFITPFSINKEGHLKKGDAQMVDIIHTDSGVIGYEDNVGNVDFYANSGRATQPPCTKINLVIYGVWKYISCSHQLSSMYFAESILTRDFIATKCNTYEKYIGGYCDGNEQIIFGEDMPMNASGVFFFRTSDIRPYSKLM